MWWRSWLKHCATTRKPRVRFPTVSLEFPIDNPSGRTVTLGSTPLTEMSTRRISWGGKRGRCVGLKTLPSPCADCLDVLGVSTSWSPQGLPRNCFAFALYTSNTFSLCKLVYVRKTGGTIPLGRPRSNERIKTKWGFIFHIRTAQRLDIIKVLFFTFVPHSVLI